MQNKDSFKGYSLFNDIKDTALRNRNRAVVLSNIAVDNARDKLISAKGIGLIMGYFGLINPDDRADVEQRFKDTMIEERGFAI